MARFNVPAIFLFACFAATSLAQQPTASGVEVYQLRPSPKTVVWGYFDPKTPPVLRIKSGDIVEIRTLMASSPDRFESAGLGPDPIERIAKRSII